MALVARLTKLPIEQRAIASGWVIALPEAADQGKTELRFFDGQGAQVERTFRLGPPLSKWLGSEEEWTSYGPIGT